MSTPALRLEARDVVRVNGSWRIRWRVANDGPDHARLVAIRAPHSRFRSEPIDLNVVVVESAIVDQTLRVAAAPGEEVPDASVVLVAVSDRETWRVAFGVRVRVEPDGTPAPLVERVEVQRVGFTEA